MAGGYAGKYCIVNLSDATTEVVTPDEAFYQKYLSGYGLGAAVILERQKPGLDPLAPQSHLGFCSGLITGSGALFAGRFMVVGKSPLTGGWGDANAGGYLSREIKRTGYDAVFFTGAAPKPVWVNITDEKIEIRDAGSLWGKDIVDTEAALKKELGDQKVQVACIGESGEKCSLISGVATASGRMACPRPYASKRMYVREAANSPRSSAMAFFVKVRTFAPPSATARISWALRILTETVSPSRWMSSMRTPEEQ